MGRDANNQMYPIAWAVVRVENAENWKWFLALLHDDLSLNCGTGITIISDSHKGLLDGVSELLPNAEHMKCTRHVYANFKKKFSGVQFRRLFWCAASSTLEAQFDHYMSQIRQLDQEAYDYLLTRDPNTWSRAFFEMDRRCASFENGICESFNRAMLIPRHKPIITMLEEIRVYVMQRLVAMNKLAFNLEDMITPSIRKRLMILTELARHWTVYPSAYQVLEVRKGDASFGVDLLKKQCDCRLWEMSGMPCVHAMAGYLHVGKDADLGVSCWFSQDMWFNTYQFSIRPVLGTSYWKKTKLPPPLPPIVRKMPGRPQKQRIRCPTEEATQVSRVGRRMTCANYWQQGHNKKGCKNETQPKPETVIRQPGRKSHPVIPQCASRGGGIGSRGRGRGRGRGVGRGGRANRGGRGDDPSTVGVDDPSTVGGDGPSTVGHDGPSTVGHDGPSKVGADGLTDKEYYERADEENLRAILEEEAMEQKQYLARVRAEQEWEDRMDWLNQDWEVSGEETSQERRARQLAFQEYVQQQAPSQQIQESLDLSVTATMEDTQADEATSTPAKNNGKDPVPANMDVDQEGPPKAKKKKCSTSTRTFVNKGVGQKELPTEN